jgi:hypothetical protein
MIPKNISKMKALPFSTLEINLKSYQESNLGKELVIQ